MHGSGGYKQRGILSEEAHVRQPIFDLSAVLQQTSPIAAHRFLASKSTASLRLAVEWLGYLLSRQLKNRCMLSGSRIDTLCAKYESFSIDERPALSRTTQERPREAGGCLQRARDMNHLRECLTPICLRTCDTGSVGRDSLHHRR
jgi:hypothetical protein